MKKTGNIWAMVLFVLWTLFIFTRSLLPAQMSNEESGWILMLLERIFPFALSHHMVRKAAHFIEFAVLGFLGRIAFSDRRKKTWERIIFPLMICFMVAVCDETIQLFVEGRAGKIADVCLDVVGAIAGVLAGGVMQLLWRYTKRNVLLRK